MEDINNNMAKTGYPQDLIRTSPVKPAYNFFFYFLMRHAVLHWQFDTLIAQNYFKTKISYFRIEFWRKNQFVGKEQETKQGCSKMQVAYSAKYL